MAVVTPEFVGRRQRKIVVNGVKYKAKAKAGCNGCALGYVGGCVQPVTTDGGSLCGAVTRKDSTSVIWIKKD